MTLKKGQEYRKSVKTKYNSYEEASTWQHPGSHTNREEEQPGPERGLPWPVSERQGDVTHEARVALGFQIKVSF